MKNQIGLKDFIFLLLGILAVSCSDNGNDPIFDGPFIIPLSNGNYWTYNVYSVNPETGEESTPRQFTITCETIPDNVNNYNPNEVFVTNYIHAGIGTPNVKYMVSNKQNGLHILGSLWDSNINYYDYLKLKFPVLKDETWDIYFSAYDDTTRITCSGMDVEYQTPMGDFSCIQYHYEYINNPGDYYEHYSIDEFYKPGLGLVGVNKYLYEPSSHEKQIRIRYKLVETNVPIPE